MYDTNIMRVNVELRSYQFYISEIFIWIKRLITHVSASDNNSTSEVNDFFIKLKFFATVKRKIVILLKIREKFSTISIKHIVAKNFQVF